MVMASSASAIENFMESFQIGAPLSKFGDHSNSRGGDTFNFTLQNLKLYPILFWTFTKRIKMLKNKWSWCTPIMFIKLRIKARTIFTRIKAPIKVWITFPQIILLNCCLETIYFHASVFYGSFFNRAGTW